MFENLMFVAIVVSVLWLASYGIYMYTSRQHQDIAQNIDTIEKMLGPDQTDENN